MTALLTPNIGKRLTDLDRKIGECLRCARMSKGMSQEALGEHLGITFQQIQKYEKGTNRLSMSAAVRAARALEISPSLLIPPELSSEDRGEPAIISDQMARRAAEIMAALPVSAKPEALAMLRAIAKAAEACAAISEAS